MKHWKSNIDSFICPVCDLEVSNPRNYPDCKCPRCGFQDIKDARLYALLARAGVKELPDRDPMTFFASTGRAQGKTLAEIKSLFKLVNQLADALETALDEADQHDFHVIDTIAHLVPAGASAEFEYTDVLVCKRCFKRKEKTRYA